MRKLSVGAAVAGAGFFLAGCSQSTSDIQRIQAGYNPLSGAVDVLVADRDNIKTVGIIQGDRENHYFAEGTCAYVRETSLKEGPFRVRIVDEKGNTTERDFYMDLSREMPKIDLGKGILHEADVAEFMEMMNALRQ